MLLLLAEIIAYRDGTLRSNINTIYSFSLCLGALLGVNAIGLLIAIFANRQKWMIGIGLSGLLIMLIGLGTCDYAFFS